MILIEIVVIFAIDYNSNSEELRITMEIILQNNIVIFFIKFVFLISFISFLSAIFNLYRFHTV